ncbi:MAG: stage 0 sporulation family protein, partial [Lachnospiraceae bacterium]|nr:stage 0 sporulation family protein [Lachnospiraceae bacterium]
SKIYYFNPGNFDVHYNDHVIVETARGLEYGTVVLSPMQLEDEKVPQPLKDMIRMATSEDNEREAENRRKEKEAYKICKEKIAERGLEMKLIQAEYTFDNSKVLFYFTADGRIDFRDLVKDLAGIFRTRIELRQIGVRDETKILGGMGICGRPLCCHTYLTEFAPVSIKMAKEQNLSLNPTKISGCCGRLMCCLKNEAETYAYLNKNLPNKGDQMTTPEGRHGEVQSIDILRQRIKCIVDMDNDEKELQEFHISEITFIPHSKRPKGQAVQQPKADKKKKKGAEADVSETSYEEEIAEKVEVEITKARKNERGERKDKQSWKDKSAMKPKKQANDVLASKEEVSEAETSLAENAPIEGKSEHSSRSRKRRRRGHQKKNSGQGAPTGDNTP